MATYEKAMEQLANREAKREQRLANNFEAAGSVAEK